MATVLEQIAHSSRNLCARVAKLVKCNVPRLLRWTDVPSTASKNHGRYLDFSFLVYGHDTMQLIPRLLAIRAWSLLSVLLSRSPSGSPQTAVPLVQRRSGIVFCLGRSCHGGSHRFAPAAHGRTFPCPAGECTEPRRFTRMTKQQAGQGLSTTSWLRRRFRLTDVVENLASSLRALVTFSRHV